MFTARNMFVEFILPFIISTSAGYLRSRIVELYADSQTHAEARHVRRRFVSLLESFLCELEDQNNLANEVSEAHVCS
jgi:hypothetical protein